MEADPRVRWGWVPKLQTRALVKISPSTKEAIFMVPRPELCCNSILHPLPWSILGQGILSHVSKTVTGTYAHNIWLNFLKFSLFMCFGFLLTQYKSIKVRLKKINKIKKQKTKTKTMHIKKCMMHKCMR